MNKKERKYVKIQEPMPGFYEIRSSFVQAHLLVGTHHALLFDTGYGFFDLPAVVREITELPIYIVNSHGHADHACGNSSFQMPVYIHPADIPVFERHNSPEYRGIMFDTVKKVQNVLFFLPIMPRNIKREQFLEDGFDDFIELTEGYTFDLGGKTAEVIGLPGHTPGSIGLYCRELRIMLVSDAMNDGVYMFLPESTKLSVYLNSLYKAKIVDFDYFVTGHSSTLFPKRNLDYYIETAENLDYPKGIIQKEHELTPGKEIRCCIRPGKSRKQKRDDDWASIIISIDKL